MPNMYDGAMRYTASGTPRSTQTPSMYICLERACSLIPLFLSWLMIFIRNAGPGFGLHISGY